MPLARLRLSFETCPRMKLVPSLAAVTRSAADPADFLPASIAVPFESDGARLLEVFSIGQVASDEWLLRLVAAQGINAGVSEAEVLLSISRGKPNRDIAEILGLCPRIVSKHLEQVFEKLGAGNRFAAAALAVRHLRAAVA